jgi:hypothetical protein
MPLTPQEFVSKWKRVKILKGCKVSEKLLWRGQRGRIENMRALIPHLPLNYCHRLHTYIPHLISHIATTKNGMEAVIHVG